MEAAIVQLQTQTDKLPRADVPIDKDYYVCRSADNVVYTTSLGLARSFGVEHKNMLRAIRNIITCYVPPELRDSFVDTEYPSQQGKPTPCIRIDYNGFIFFCLNYSAGDAMIKIKYIEVMTRLANCIRNAYNTDVGILSSKVDTLQQTALPAMVQTPDYSDPVQRRRLIDQAFLLAKQDLDDMEKVIAQQAQQIQAAQPAVEFAAAVSDCDDTILVYELAANITQRLTELGIQGHITQNSLYKYLRQHGYVNNQRGVVWNKPRVKAIQDGLLKVRESIYKDNAGNEHLSRVTGVTGKGQLHFMEEILQIYKNGGTI